MAVKVKYEAKDGKQFDRKEEAEEWDNSNFDVWLEGNPTINARIFVDSMDGGAKDEYYSNDRKLARDLIRKYWNDLET